EKRWLRIVGGVDVDPAKVGKTLAELCGNSAFTLSRIYKSFDELWEKERPDVVLHTAGSKAEVAIEQIKPMAEKGTSVISSCEELLFPRLRAERQTEELAGVCKKSGARVLGTGVNPGFV